MEKCFECEGPEDFRGIKVCGDRWGGFEGQSRYAVLENDIGLKRVCLKHYGSEEKILKKLRPLIDKGLIVVDRDKNLQNLLPLDETYCALFK